MHTLFSTVLTCNSTAEGLTNFELTATHRANHGAEDPGRHVRHDIAVPNEEGAQISEAVEHNEAVLAKLGHDCTGASGLVAHGWEQKQ
ncbi:hypothetical protein E1202_07870 [Saccharopolyspora karakumensis]|uniref:Uncharacterized protein n=1 Tax=Saccharopolyspora karakumensis TaxID=2530386 RepID=A0A4R5C1F3_9PSEU|nr:hypothetical protein [Saccharopolyspora karakumensis]TDD90542.1 hypothetical protein E1202_07870 [Saccharopolyspora karakumensis]